MSTYRYEAFDAGGLIKRGLIEAVSPEDAGTKIRELGFFPQSIERNSSTPMKTILPGASAGDKLVAGVKEDPSPGKIGLPCLEVPGKKLSRVSEKKTRHPKKESKPVSDRKWPTVRTGDLETELSLIAAFYVEANKTAGKSFRGILAEDVMKAELKVVVAGLVRDAFKRGFEDFGSDAEEQM